MEVIFILKDFTAAFYEGAGESTIGLLNVANVEKFYKLNEMARERRVPMKIGDGSFRDKVELNALIRDYVCEFNFTLEPRKGYKLATFTIEKAAL